jgi:hypothetical protein
MDDSARIKFEELAQKDKLRYEK